VRTWKLNWTRKNLVLPLPGEAKWCVGFVDFSSAMARELFASGCPTSGMIDKAVRFFKHLCTLARAGYESSFDYTKQRMLR
jgi:hypothetical protein